ncbi:hypothetical protein [Thalassotalea litorea]|uniref:hypothetical protein n=1 Tax=Thalassotalea litorea TaxID=2020715 RepID=UPI003736C453
MDNEHRRRAKTTLLSDIDSDEYYHGKSPQSEDAGASAAQGTGQDFLPLEVPFEYRHCCWFCKEPAARMFNYPTDQIPNTNDTAKGMAIPACHECAAIANKHKKLEVSQLREKVNAGLRKLYRKDLAIGVNWTKEELENSGFEGGNFEGFARSAWFMYEIARDRVNFKGWPLQLHGLKLHEEQQSSFHFDGTDFNDVEQAIAFYAQTYRLDPGFLNEAVYRLSPDRFADALRLARICQDFSALEREEALNRLTQSLGLR